MRLLRADGVTMSSEKNGSDTKPIVFNEKEIFILKDAVKKLGASEETQTIFSASINFLVEIGYVEIKKDNSECSQ